MTGPVLKARRRRRTTGEPRPSVREVALLGRVEAAGWSPGQRVAWAGRAYVVAGSAGEGAAQLRLAPGGEP
jgi:hypothetical protein